MRTSRSTPLTSVAVALPSSAAVAAPHAGTAGTCSIRGVERKLGPTYVTSLKATGTTCGSAKRLVKAFHACRKQNGGKKGYCRRSVNGYRCSEKRGGIATEITGKVTCRNGSATVIHTYTQFI